MSVKRHTLYNVIGAVVPLGVSLLTVPAYLHEVGEARFGILSIAWLLLGYFGLLDLGLGMATAQQIAARQEEGQIAQARIFWTALLTNFGLGVLGGLVALPVATYYFGHSIKVSDSLRAEMIRAIPWLILAVPMATITGVATGALQGLKRFANLNIISIAGAMLFQLVPLAAAFYWSPALTVVLPVSLATQAVTLAMLMFECHRTLLKGQTIAYDRSELRILFRFGFWVTVPCLFVPLLSMLDRFVIGAFVGAAAVSLYAVPFNLGQRLCVVGNSAGTALFPRFSSLANQDSVKLADDSERVVSAIMLIVITLAIFLIGPFLSIWIGSDFAARARSVAQILMVGVWLESVSRIPLYALRGQSRPKTIALVEAAQLIPFWIILYVLVLNYGLVGVAAAYVLRSGANYLLLAERLGTLRRVWMVTASSFIFLMVALQVARALTPFSLSWTFGLLCSASVSAILAWYFLPVRTQRDLRSRIPGHLMS